MVAGVHYPEGEEPAVLARRLLRVNLSDLAAMGADATAYALGLALPADVGDDWVEDFAAGLVLDQETFGVALIGGDTVATAGPAVLSLTAFGTVAGDCLPHPRGCGRRGDDVYVSGHRRRCDAGPARGAGAASPCIGARRPCGAC